MDLVEIVFGQRIADIVVDARLVRKTKEPTAGQSHIVRADPLVPRRPVGCQSLSSYHFSSLLSLLPFIGFGALKASPGRLQKKAK